MARYAMVHEIKLYVGGVVEWDGDTTYWLPPAGFVMIADSDPPTANPGGNWDPIAEVFNQPPTGMDPASLTRPGPKGVKP